MKNKKEKDIKYQKHLKVKLKKFNSPTTKLNKNPFGTISLKQKIKNEIETMPNESRNTFREVLNKHSFTLEVFIPTTKRVNKNEYKNKNYLLNTLISFEDKIREQKELVDPIKKETNRFSKQYKLIKEENGEHQKNYVENFQKYYENMGYNPSGIEYKENDNIFSPSSILDQDFGTNIQEDAFKYSNIEYKKDYHKDQILIKRWRQGVKDTKDNKNRIKNRQLEDESPEMYTKEKEENIDTINENLMRFEKESLLQKEKEREKEELQKELDEIKKNLMEENRIKNMSRKEYYLYNQELKNDIQKTKESLKEFSKNKTDISANKLNISNLKNMINTTVNNIKNSNDMKSRRRSVMFSTQEFTKNNKIIFEDKKVKKKKNYLKILQTQTQTKIIKIIIIIIIILIIVLIIT